MSYVVFSPGQVQEGVEKSDNLTLNKTKDKQKVCAPGTAEPDLSK